MDRERPLRLLHGRWERSLLVMLACSLGLHLVAGLLVVLFWPRSEKQPIGPLTAYTVSISDLAPVGQAGENRTPGAPGPTLAGGDAKDGKPPQAAPVKTASASPARADETVVLPPALVPEAKPPPPAAKAEESPPAAGAPSETEAEQGGAIAAKLAPATTPPVRTAPQQEEKPAPPEAVAAKTPPAARDAAPAPAPEPQRKKDGAETKPRSKTEPAARKEPAKDEKPKPAQEREATPTTTAARKTPPPAAAAKPPAEAAPAEAAASPSPTPAGAEARPAPTPGAGAPAAEADGYAAAIERVRQRVTGAGGGLGGNGDPAKPASLGGSGPGGGNQVVGAEFLIYYNILITRIRQAWLWVGHDDELATTVRFAITAEGQVRDVRIDQSSGDAGYDASVLRAIHDANPLPPPPRAYLSDFGDVVLRVRAGDFGAG
jgi:TonB family protein